MPTSAELVAAARRQVRAVSLDEIRRRLAAREPMVLVDVREKDETSTGVIPGAILLPRGLLELSIEQKVPDRAAPVVVYCAGGTRSARPV